MRLAHLSDLHLTSPAGLTLRDAAGKRALGWLSWRLRRRGRYRLEVVDLLLEDLARASADHVVVTGDLTHLGLASELAEAGAWLPRLGRPEAVTVIPGNHDVYVARDVGAEPPASWAPYHRSDEGETGFPLLRVREPIALVGLSSAAPTRNLDATGALGAAQIEAAGRRLRETGGRGLFRVVALHHPPLEGTVSWRRRLVDAGLFRETVAEAGAELVLHGHAHRTCRGRLPTRDGEAVVIGARSGSSLSSSAESRAQYHLYDLEPGPEGWSLEVLARGLDAAGRGFETIWSERHAIPRSNGGPAT